MVVRRVTRRNALKLGAASRMDASLSGCGAGVVVVPLAVPESGYTLSYVLPCLLKLAMQGGKIVPHWQEGGRPDAVLEKVDAKLRSIPLTEEQLAQLKQGVLLRLVSNDQSEFLVQYSLA